MTITKLEDLSNAIKLTYKNSDQTQSFPISLTQSGFLSSSKIEGGLNLQYFTSLKEYQILGITILKDKKKIEFSKSEKVAIIKWFSSQGDIYEFLAKLFKTYTWMK